MEGVLRARNAQRQRQTVRRQVRQPRLAEVLFERICREKGVTQQLTKPRSSSTTGKVERLYQTLGRFGCRIPVLHLQQG